MSSKRQANPERNRSAWKCSVPALAGLLLLSGCANLPDWIPDLTGGEGKTAQSVSSRIIDDAPAIEQAPVPEAPAVHKAPTREEVLAIQTDLEALGYNPGRPDGIAGSKTKEAIKAYQKDAGWVVDGHITDELASSLAAAPRPEKPLAPAVAVAPELPPEPEITPEVEPEIEQAIEPEVEVVIEPEVEPEVEIVSLPDDEPEIKGPVMVVHVDNADIPPFYDTGDAYIWSNGRVETVVRVADNKLYWRVDNGVSFTADRNFMVPPSSWTGPAGSGEAVARLDERAIWPLAGKLPVTFKVEDNGEMQTWQCRISGTDHVSVPAGNFDAVALACDRDQAPAGEWVRRIWHYAPAVRHYVARVDFMPDGSRRSKELVGIRPGAEDWPPAVRAGLNRAIQDALGGTPDGKRSSWSSTVVKEEFVILPNATYDAADGKRCRTFELTARSAGTSRIYPAQACLFDDGKKWRIPDNRGDQPKGDSFLTSAS